jgi:hypothetical protein
MSRKLEALKDAVRAASDRLNMAYIRADEDASNARMNALPGIARLERACLAARVERSNAYLEARPRFPETQRDYLAAQVELSNARLKAFAADPFEQTFADVANVLAGSWPDRVTPDMLDEAKRLDAVTRALDKLHPLEFDRTVDLLLKTATLAALTRAAATELQAAAKSRVVVSWSVLDRDLAAIARAELRATLEALEASHLGDERPRP